MASPELVRGEPLVITLVKYTSDEFSPELFVDQKIHCPAQIAMSVRRRQAEYFFGRFCAREALAGLGQAAAEVGTGASREPLWPLGTTGTITHNVMYAAALAVRQEEYLGVGIDLEAIVTEEFSTALIETVVSDGELAYLRAEAWQASFQTLLTIVFSAKESFFKAVFPTVKRYFDFGAIKIDSIDFASSSLQFVVREYLSPELRPGDKFSVSFLYIDAGTILTSCRLPQRCAK